MTNSERETIVPLSKFLLSFRFPPIFFHFLSNFPTIQTLLTSLSPPPPHSIATPKPRAPMSPPIRFLSPIPMPRRRKTLLSPRQIMKKFRFGPILRLGLKFIMGQNGTQFHSPNVGTAPRFPTVVRERVRREAMEIGAQKASSLRWKLLRQALLRRHRLDLRSSDERSEITVNRISRKSKQGFNLIRCQFSNNDDGSDDSASSSKPNDARDVTLSYILPLESSPRLVLTQRASNVADLSDLEFCNNHNIDNTGIVCQWPSEDVLAYFCLSHADMFRSKRVIELGAGYGLAGLVIAAVTDASEVVISDGNPQVVNYIESNIEANSKAFGDTQVKPMKLHWSRDKISDIAYSFDLIVASDCTFFKEFHTGLAQLVNCLLKKVGPCEAMFFSPKRGDSLDRFLEEITVHGLKFSITEKYDDEIWKCHQSFINGDDDSWPSYEKDHCYPLLVRITR